MKAKLLLVLFGILLGLGTLEIALRFILPKREGEVFSSVNDFRAEILDSKAALGAKRTDGVPFASIINPHPSDRIIYELQPNLTTKFTNVQVTTNSCGLRGPERPIGKSPGVYRIALLGDSFAFGWGVAQDKTFAQVLEDTLNRLTGGAPKVEVVNLGVPGYSTFQEVSLLEEKGLDFNPDAVLLFFIHNDFDFPFFIRDNNSAAGVVQSFSLMRVGQQFLDPKLAEAKSNMRGLEPQRMLLELDQVTKRLGIKGFVTINPRKEWKSCYRRLKKSLEASSLEYIDLVSDFDSYVARHGYSDSELNLPKDIHPSELRSRIYGELLAPELWAEIERSKPALGIAN